MGLLKEFREFAVKGNAIDMAVGIIIGAAFGKIVNSVVNDLIMPPIGLLLGGADFRDLKLVLKEGIAAGTDAAGSATPEIAEVAIRYGLFINVLLDFLIVAFCVFMMVKAMNTARKRFEKEETKKA
jgi:large conductance mechanosensitive channel